MREQPRPFFPTTLRKRSLTLQTVTCALKSDYHHLALPYGTMSHDLENCYDLTQRWWTAYEKNMLLTKPLSKTTRRYSVALNHPSWISTNMLMNVFQNLAKSLSYVTRTLSTTSFSRPSLPASDIFYAITRRQTHRPTSRTSCFRRNRCCPSKKDQELFWRIM